MYKWQPPADNEHPTRRRTTRPYQHHKTHQERADRHPPRLTCRLGSTTAPLGGIGGLGRLALTRLHGQSTAGNAARRPARIRVAAACAVVSFALALTAGTAGATSHSEASLPATWPHTGVQHGEFVVLGGSPGAPAINPVTSTVYVPIQCAASFCSTPAAGHVVDVIDAATCNAGSTSGCRVVARARVGSSPLAAAIDTGTDTVYVTNGNDNTVSVLNGATCNARVTRGCGHPVATVRVGKFPVAAVVNPATSTLYVADAGGGRISVINAAACNRSDTRGCGQRARTVRDNASPSWLDVDVATDTVYVANDVTPGTVSVIDGAGCNGSTGRGCRRTPATVSAGANPEYLAVDQASDSIYVGDFGTDGNSGSVSVIDGARCNARTTTGCTRRPATVPTGIGTSTVAVDNALHTVFAVNSGDDTLSAINSLTCNGTVTASCGQRPRNIQATHLQQPGFNSFPGGLVLSQSTDTGYVVNVGGLNILSVDGIRRCNATDTSGCRAEAPGVRDAESLLATDPVTDTIYAGNATRPDIDVIDGATCRAGHLADCAPVAEIPVPDAGARVGAISDATHTLYASDEAAAGTVAVINTATCNASDTSGCGVTPPEIAIGADPGPPALNPATQTLYVPFGATASQVAVVNVAACTSTDDSGCGEAPAVVTVGTGTNAVAISQGTDTIYAPATGQDFDGDTVALINGATCNGTDHAGCGHLAATATVGLAPYGVAVDDHTHTVYVVDNTNGDSPGTVSVINTATCNATVTTGCGGPFPTAPTGTSPLLIAADPGAGLFYITDYSSASVTVLNGSRCNAGDTAGCRTATREQAVGSGPVGLAVNPATRTVYVAITYLPGFMSVF
jgi:DNA-binding beta-propeller fold protein YncE